MNKIIAEDLDFILNNDIDWEKFKNKTVFITGAYGMLLSYMTYTLLRLNELDSKFNVKVIVLTRNKEKAKKKFRYFAKSKYLKFFEHDLSSPIKIEGEIDYIVHGASYASPHYFAANPVAVILPNAIGTYYLLELAKLKKIKSFLFFSSGSVYGDANAKSEITEKDYGYMDPLNVNSCYGESKRMAENMCKCFQYQFEIPVKIVRPAHTYGPTMDIENDSRVFANFVNNIIKGKNIIMKSDGSAIRSFSYIADVTVAFFKVLLDGENGEAYNVGDKDSYISIKELAEMFISLAPKKQLKLIIKKQTADISNKDKKTLMSFKKVENLNWKCAFSLKEGLKRTVESYLN